MAMERARHGPDAFTADEMKPSLHGAPSVVAFVSSRDAFATNAEKCKS
jgi:hypothetical protein